uniref:HTH OST-type domain-containing protein n=1 Tax=Strongyloides stercoralis TaxID=6248 RepID=A0A0K0EQD8_STRER
MDSISEIIRKVRSCHAEVSGMTVKRLIKDVKSYWNVDLKDFAYNNNFGPYRDVNAVANFMKQIEGVELSSVPFDKHDYFIKFERPDNQSQIVSMIHNSKNKKRGTHKYYNQPCERNWNEHFFNNKTQEIKEDDYYNFSNCEEERKDFKWIVDEEFKDIPESSIDLQSDTDTLRDESLDFPTFQSSHINKFCVDDFFENILNHAVVVPKKKNKKKKQKYYPSFYGKSQESTVLGENKSNLNDSKNMEEKANTNIPSESSGNKMSPNKEQLNSQPSEKVKEEVDCQWQDASPLEDDLFDEDEDILPTMEEVEIFLKQIV